METIVSIERSGFRLPRLAWNSAAEIPRPVTSLNQLRALPGERSIGIQVRRGD